MYKAHDRHINDVALDQETSVSARSVWTILLQSIIHSSINLIIISWINKLSAADDGTVVLTYFNDFFAVNKNESIKDKIVAAFSEPIHAIAIESIAIGSRDRSILVGGLSGQLIRHHTVWFTQKNSVLYKGDSNPVTTIKRSGTLVAWADCFYVRILGK